MTIKIDRPIVGYSIAKDGDDEPKSETVVEDQGPLERPDMALGRTYKLRRPSGSLFLTINRDEAGRPIELFVNSKAMDQGHVAMTRLASMALRARIDPKMIAEELRSIQDPDSGYFVPGGGGYVPSTMAHIGKTLEHDTAPTATPAPEPEPEQDGAAADDSGGMAKCPECGDYTLVYDGGCPTCTSPDCAYSKCG